MENREYLDVDGYPTEDALKEIREFNKVDHESMCEFIDFLKSIWWAADWGFIINGKILELHTGGWSGNEDIISELTKSSLWILFWQSSRRGGHYLFELPFNIY